MHPIQQLQRRLNRFGLYHGVNHYENFPVASILCPRALRPAVAAIYWFARTADDIADEGNATPTQRQADLAAYRADLLACSQGFAFSARWSVVFKNLQTAIAQWSLPLELLHHLLDAFEQDVRQAHYANENELLQYCALSANPVGRLLLHLYRVQDQESLTQSDCICTGLQLINFWQDLSLDLARNRVYVPTNLIKKYGLTALEMLQKKDSPATRALTKECVQWAQTLLHKGMPLAQKIPGRAGFELKLVVQGGLRIAEKIQQLDGATLSKRPRLGKADALIMAWRALRMPSLL